MDLGDYTCGFRLGSWKEEDQLHETLSQYQTKPQLETVYICQNV